MQGVVETINDVLRTPYAQSRSQSINNGTHFMKFDVPTGKRLIVEMIAVNLTHLPEDKFFVELSTPSYPSGSVGRAFMPISLTTTRSAYDPGVPTLQRSVGVHAVTLRVDGETGADNELLFAVDIKTSPTGSFGFAVNVRGYLVDIPTN